MHQADKILSYIANLLHFSALKLKLSVSVLYDFIKNFVAIQMISRTIELERINNELKVENESLKTENVHLSTENVQLQLEIQQIKVS